MGSVPAARRRPVPVAEEWRHLRRRLLDCYRADPRYRNIIAYDLRPRWQAARAETTRLLRQQFPDLTPEQVYFEDLEELLIEDWRGGHRCATPLVAYFSAVYFRAVATMGLFCAGAPAHWAGPLIHADVTGGEPPYVDRDIEKFVHHSTHVTDTIRLRLEVTPRRAKVATDWSRYDGCEISFGEESSSLDADPGTAFDHWAALGAQAHRQLDDQLAALRAFYEAWFEQRNVASLARRERDLPLLCRHLFHGTPVPDRADRERLRRLARRIGIDFPPRRTETGPISA